MKLDELMAALKKKDDDMRAMEERYKMYLEKARNVSDKSFIFLFFFVFYCSFVIPLKHKVESNSLI